MNPWSSLRGLSRGLWILSGVTFINRAGTMALPFLALYLAGQPGVGLARAGLAPAVYGAAALIAAPLGGWLCDHVAPLHVIEASLLLAGATVVLLPLAHGLSSFLAITFLWALFAETFRPAYMAAIAEFAGPEKRRTAFALIRLAVNLGMSVGPAIGGFLAAVSFPLLFSIDGATSLLAGALLLLWRRRTPETTPSVAPPSTSSPPSASILTALRDRRYMLFLLAVLPVTCVFFQLTGPLALYLVHDLHLPESAYGLLFTVNTLVVVALEVPLTGAMSSWSHRSTLALGSALIGVGFGAFALVHGLGGAVAATVLWTFGEMILLPAMAAQATDYTPEIARGRYLGLFQMAFSLSFAVGPWAGTVLLAQAGSRVLWGTAFLGGAASAVAFLLLAAPADPGAANSPPAGAPAVA